MKHLSSFGFKPRSLSALVAAAFATSNLALPHAEADVYHVVVSGDTLASVAARYHVPAETLRALNKLDNPSINDALPQMLLRIPDGREKAPTGALPLALAPEARPARSKAPSMSGTLSSALTYSVQPGDSWESIAAAHQKAGYQVSAAGIQQENAGAELKAGSTIMVPLQSTTIKAPAASSAKRRAASGLRTISSGGATVEGATVSAEMAGSTWLPAATEVPAKAPVYKAPGTKPAARPAAKAAGKPATRGPATLSSRGHFPSPNMDGVRVLGPQEDAPNVGSTPQPRVRAAAPAKAKPARVAHVAKVALTGARIRRLPDANAATLYRCGVGTEIAVIKQSGAWSAILMSDRSTGWVPGKYLKMTGQQVDISAMQITDHSKVVQNGINGRFTSNNAVVAQALTWLGTRYVYGGTTRRGVDCSALVQNASRAVGIRLPRTAAQQARVGTPVSVENLQPGDRVYFSKSGTYIDHTGLYMGNGMFVHASGSGRSVIVSKLSDRRNWNIYVGARR